MCLELLGQIKCRWPAHGPEEARRSTRTILERALFANPLRSAKLLGNAETDVAPF